MAYTFVVVCLFIEYQSKRFVYHNSSWAVKVEFINCDWAKEGLRKLKILYKFNIYFINTLYYMYRLHIYP